MIKTFSVLFLILEGSKALETHSKNLRPTVSLPRNVTDPFENIFGGGGGRRVGIDDLKLLKIPLWTFCKNNEFHGNVFSVVFNSISLT